MDTFQKACELAAYYQVGDVNGLIEGVAQALARMREAALEEAAKVADAYTERMEKAATKPHPVTGKENTVAWCKADAGDTIRIAIRALKDCYRGRTIPATMNPDGSLNFQPQVGEVANVNNWQCRVTAYDPETKCVTIVPAQDHGSNGSYDASSADGDTSKPIAGDRT